MEYIRVCLVGVIWGVTNPFMERYSKKNDKTDDKLDLSGSRVLSAFSNLKFLLAFGFNQLGSVL